jgi:hypothetical protein
MDPLSLAADEEAVQQAAGDKRLADEAVQQAAGDKRFRTKALKLAR